MCAALGVPAGLLKGGAQANAMRESTRHFATWTLGPIAKAAAAELTEKTGQAVEIDIFKPMQAWDSNGRARAAGAIVSALTQAKDAGLDPATVAKAFNMVGWRSPDE